MGSPPLLTLPFPEPLLPGRLVRRYNRFLADIQLDDGRAVVAHCVNTGRMEGLTAPGLRVWISRKPGEGRVLAHTWELAELDGHLIGTNTALPNFFVRRLLEDRLLPGLHNWEEMKPERKYGENSRIDFWLRTGKQEHFIEVKNCHLVYPDDRGYFPDSVSERASKHLEELIEVVRRGHRATVIFTAQRAGTKSVRPSDVHDPLFAETARRAHQAGVAFKALCIRPTPDAMIIESVIPADMKPYKTERMAAWRDANRALGPAWVTVRKQR